MKSEHRAHGTIREVRTGYEDGRFVTTWVFVDLDDGGTQGFGGWSLAEHQEAWNAELCALFGVSKLDDLVGKHCWALRSFSGWNEQIEGLEGTDGKRLVATAFWRKRLPAVQSVLEKRRESIERDIAHHTRRIKEQTHTLARLENDYVEWSATPSRGEADR
jgi:hypothetical protein